MVTDMRTAEFDDVEPQAAFWRRHVRIGISLYAIGAIGVLVYAFVTPSGRNRPALVALDGLTLVASLTLFRWVGLRLVTTRWREQFFFAWSVSTVVFIGSAAALDGGTHSPLSYLLVLPLMFAALAYAPRYVVWLALLAVAMRSGHRLGDSTPSDGCDPGHGSRNCDRRVAHRCRRLQPRPARPAAGGHGGARQHDGVPGPRRVQQACGRGGRSGAPVRADVRARHDRRRQPEATERLGGTQGRGRRASRSVAAGLKAAARASDVVGRLGGDEFAVLLPETGAFDVETVLERLRSVIYGAEDPVPVTLSLGSTVWSGSGDSAEAIFSRADDALYAAKQAGRGRSVAWDPSTLHLQNTLPRIESPR